MHSKLFFYIFLLSYQTQPIRILHQIFDENRAPNSHILFYYIIQTEPCNILQILPPFDPKKVHKLYARIEMRSQNSIKHPPSDWAIRTLALSCQTSSPASWAACRLFWPQSLASWKSPSSRWHRPISWCSHVASSADFTSGSFSVQCSTARSNLPMRA